MFGEKREARVRDKGEKLKLNVNTSRASHRPVLNTPCWEGSLDLDLHTMLEQMTGTSPGTRKIGANGKRRAYK